MKATIVICSCILLCCSAVLAGFSGSDNFDDGEINTNLWDEHLFIPSVVEETLVETNGHLYFATTSIGNERAILPSKAFAPFFRDWIFTVSVALPDFENNTEQEYKISLMLSPHNAAQIPSNHLGFAMSKNEDNQKVFTENYVTNDIEVHNVNVVRSDDAARLRLRWAAATSNLYSEVSIDGGSTWTNYWGPTTNPFGMNPFDYFSCSIYSSSKGRAIALSDNLYCDNFEINIEAHAPLSGSDDFNDNVKNNGKWYSINSQLNEVNGRLEYSATGLYDEYGIWAWSPNEGGQDDNWSVTIDAHNSSTPIESDQNGNIEVSVFKDLGKLFFIGMETFGTGTQTEKNIITGWTIGDDDTELQLPIGSASATLRIAYDAASKTLFSLYDSGSGFISATNLNTESWGMEDNESISVWIAGFSDNMAISSGQIYADNFEAVTLPNNANITNCYPAVSGFKLEWVPVEEWGSVVKWSTNLVSMPFTNLSANLAYPLNSYTDTVHGAEDKCFYEVDVRME